MKVKTFILTFLMMMSSPFLFGQHWVDPDLGSDNGMPITATIHLDGSQQTSSYQVAAFYKSTLLEVQTITAIEIPENFGGGSLYHVDMNVPNINDGGSMNGIYFKFFDGTNEYVSVEKVDYDEDGLGIHTNPYEINFKTVAQIEGTGFDVVYPSLQKAIDAAANGDVVTLLKDNAENVTVVQAPDVAFTIDGAEKTMSGTITVNGKSQAYATAGLTIKNVNFDATNIADASIMLGVSGNNNTRYTNGVTVKGCDFTGNGQTKVAIKNYTGGCKNLTVTGGTFTGLHSLAQLKGVTGLTITGVTVKESGRGISVGTSTNVAISNSTFDVNSYGVRADGEGAYTMTLEDNTISAELPVVVRKAKEVAYDLKIEGDNNNFTAKQLGNNPEGYQVVFTTGDDGTYLAPTTGQFVLSVPENFNVYPVYVAQVGNLKYTTINAAIAAAQEGETVTILAGEYTQDLNINKAITVQGERNDQGENLVNINGKLNITANNATAKNLNVDNGNGNGAYINAKDVTVDGCTVVGGNGFRSCYTKGLVTFKNSTITGSTYGIHFDGSAGGEIVIDNCVITGWTSFAKTITKVTMKDTSFEEGNYNYVRFYQGEVVIEGCTFNKNMAIDIAIDGNTTTIDDCTFENGNIEDLFEDKDIVNSTIIVDGNTLKREASIGNTYYETLAEAFAAAQNGDEVKILVAGTYDLSTSGKNITITGAVEGVVFDNIGKKNMGGANVTFNNVTFDYYPNVNYTGLQHSGDLVYNNCIINGQVFLYGTSETFNNCTFNQNSANAYNVWTYGAADVNFNECTFNSVGKSVLIYTESATAFNDVAVTKCTFNASASVDGKAAIEMDSSLSAGINLTIDGATTATGFGSGNVSGNSLWNNKKGNTTQANNDITVVVDGVTVLAPTIATIGEVGYFKLQSAFDEAQDGETIVMTGDVTVAEEVVVNNIAKAVTLDMNGKTWNGAIKPSSANLTIKNGTINNENASYSAIEINAGELNLENVKVTSARHAVRIDGGVTATINGGEYRLNATSGTRHAVNVSGGADVTIKAGTFVGPKGTTMDSGAAIKVQAGSTVTIEGGNFSGGKNNTLSSNGTLTVKGGTFDQNPSAYVELPYVVIKKSDNEYNVIKGVAKIGETYYASLASAIAGATAGNTIELLTDIEENVTVNKSVTIDGGNKNYTGTMTGNAGLTVTVQNANFVNAGFVKNTTSTTGTYTFKNCTFDGKDSYAYPLSFRGANKVIVENCSVKDYQYSFLYIRSATLNVSVKNVTVEDCPSYAVYFASGVTNSMIENLTVKNSNNGFVIDNTANRALTIKNCKLENVVTAINHSKGTKSITCTMLGNENDFGTSALSDYAKITLAATDAKLTAQEGLNVTTNVEDHVVEYNEGVYSVVAANVELLSNEGVSQGKFATLQQAIDAAQSGDKVVILKDLTVGKDNIVLFDGYNTFFKVENKGITIDLNGCGITGDVTGIEPKQGFGLVAMFSIKGGGQLTLEDKVGTAQVKIENADINGNNNVYSLISCYDIGKGSKLTINGGSYNLNRAKDCLIHSADDESVTINGGTFKLGNVGEEGVANNYHPWIFNANGQNVRNVVVNGGTFNADVNHLFWANEVYVPETKALSQNADGTWTVVESVAYVTERATSTGAYDRKVGYATLAEAVVAKATDNTVTMLEDVELANTLTIAAGNEVVLDLNGKVVSYESAVVGEDMITNKGKLTIESSVEGGKLTYKNTDETGANVTISTISTEPGSELIINGGIIENTSLANNTSKVLVPYTIDILTNGNLGDVTVTINGGSIISENYIAIRQFVNGNVCNNSLTVKGGSITAKKRAINVQDAQGGGQVKNCAKLHVEKGEITATEDGGYSICNFANSENISVIGGTFVGAVYSAVNGIISGGTFDAEPYYAYCAEGFAAVNNGDGTWTVMPAQEQKLVKGWNWYSSYLNVSITDLTTALGANAIQIKGQTQSEGYMDYVPDWGWTGPMTTIDFAKMYMINTTEACEMKLAAELLNPEDYKIVVNPGWSWIGYPSNQGVSVSVAFKNLTPKEGDIIKTRNSGHAEFAWGMWVGTLKTMVPGEGYMYRNTDGTAKDFYYNIDTDSRDVAEANITAENNYWTPNVAEYPFNMTITAVLDGEMMNDNYEIAAFVNGEVRGSARPIYIEPLDAYMFFLTIHGNDVEEMTFKCYDLTSGEEYMLDNRMNYSNDAIVGSVNKPYVFSRGTMGVGEASLSDINIYPNPTTTGTEINLQTVCDKVEVFNALGVMVAEYQNVDSIDAFETAGIYVIRLTNNGDVKHCKLTVR